MIEPTDLDWLALCLCTESNRPEEWPAIAQVIENRLRSGRWGSTLRDVVLAPGQFSAFNVYRRAEHLTDARAGEIFGHRAKSQAPLLLMRSARGDWSGPWAGISKETLHYYSPVSMKPPGSKPAWAAQAERLYTPPGLDPERLIFAEGVP
jgi:hypothetical protein